MRNLFETPELLPKRIIDILNTFEDNTYEECARVRDELETYGYTYDYYLDAQPYGLRHVGMELNELEGFENI